MTTATAQPLVTLSDRATDELRRLIAAEGRDDVGLRVFVSPGGCSGLSYGMSLDEETDDGDFVVAHNGMRIFVDEFSASFVKGARIDYAAGLMAAGFTVQNPNAKKSCACGQSFDTGENAATAQKCS
ncbi:MAG: HesB/IscA family protein [Chloroflexota bacterium]|jgi:iron-sulfur cluster assembly protein|nr:iron-sulfur cluster assembly accessory protein [Chloroflexota bacterium]